LPIAQRIYLTKIHHVFDADVFFPTLDPQLWAYALIQERPADTKNSYDLTFECYERMI